MKVRLKRDSKLIETDTIIIFIGDNRFRIMDTDNYGISINKMSDAFSNDINIFPCSSNVIEIS